MQAETARELNTVNRSECLRGLITKRAEERISELKEISVESSKCEMQQENNNNKYVMEYSRTVVQLHSYQIHLMVRNEMLSC